MEYGQFAYYTEFRQMKYENMQGLLTHSLLFIVYQKGENEKYIQCHLIHFFYHF